MDQTQQTESGSSRWHSKYHWWCCIRPVLGIVLWVLGAISLIMAWMVLRTQSPILGYNDVGWYLNALVFSLLAIPLKMGWGGKHHYCNGEWCKHEDHHS